MGKAKNCPICKKLCNDKVALFSHIETHDDVPKDWSGARYYFNYVHGRTTGKCAVCGKETTWNESTNRPNKFCINPRCKQIYREEFLKRMTKVYGREHLLDDPEVQKKMLANRKISGTYKWSTGESLTYTGSYEKDFLQFLDVFFNFEASDMMSPAPQVFNYTYEGKEHFWIPDFYIASLNLIIEIKDGGDNPNTHHKIMAVDKHKEALKDDVMKKQSQYNYIKVVDKKYGDFFDYVIKLKLEDIVSKKENFRTNRIMNEQLELLMENLNEDNDDNVYIVYYSDKYIKDEIGLAIGKTDRIYRFDLETQRFIEDRINVTDREYFTNSILQDKEISDIIKNEYLFGDKSIYTNKKFTYPCEAITDLISTINPSIDLKITIRNDGNNLKRVDDFIIDNEETMLDEYLEYDKDYHNCEDDIEYAYSDVGSSSDMKSDIMSKTNGLFYSQKSKVLDILEAGDRIKSEFQKELLIVMCEDLEVDFKNDLVNYINSLNCI